MMQPFNSGYEEWNNLITRFSNAHILQSWEWGEFKGNYGWKVRRFVWRNEQEKIVAAAQILQRSIKILRIGPVINILYVPRGPLLDWSDNILQEKVLSDLRNFAFKNKSLFIKIDPEIIENDEIKDQSWQKGADVSINILKRLGWVFSPEQIQFRNTFWLDLNPPEEQLLAGMKQKTRYNIHLAERKGVKIHQIEASDFKILYDLYAQTSYRDKFIIRPKEYYFSLWEMMFKNKKACGLLASVNNEPVAAIILFFFAKKGWYFFGMSSNQERDKMPNYLLQWEAIKLAKKLGYSIYDLWGAPDKVSEDDRMWGVFRFKEGLGAKFISTIGAWDFPTNYPGFIVYHRLLPIALSFTRLFRKNQIKNEISD